MHLIDRTLLIYLVLAQRSFSGPLSDMVKTCGALRMGDTPQAVFQSSADFEILLSIITGQGIDVVNRPANWDVARNLFSLMHFYKLNAYYPWFSQMCRSRATEQPWEAIFLACHQLPFDGDLITIAMAKGFEKQSFCNTFYYSARFVTMAGVDSCASLDVVNIKPDLGLRLGLRGLLAYHSTFSPMPPHIGAAPISWIYWADSFVRNMYAIEARYKLVSNVSIQ